MASYILRSLPGIGEVEALLKERDSHPNPNWAPANDKIPGKVDEVSRRLFGITEEETYFDKTAGAHPLARVGDEDAWNRAWDAWEARFVSWIDEDDPSFETQQLLSVWAALNWDISDGNGGLLPSFAYFQRQMTLATRGELGRLPDSAISAEEMAAEADVIAKRLLASGWAKRSS